MSKKALLAEIKQFYFISSKCHFNYFSFREPFTVKKKIHIFVYFSQGRVEFTGVLAKIQSKN